MGEVGFLCLCLSLVSTSALADTVSVPSQLSAECVCLSLIDLFSFLFAVCALVSKKGLLEVFNGLRLSPSFLAPFSPLQNPEDSTYIYLPPT